MNVFQKILEQMLGKKLPIDEAVSEADYAEGLDVSLQELKRSPLLIEDDKSFASVPAIKSRCNEIQTKTGIRLLIIDYLQLMNGEADDVCRELKDLAMKLECPVLLMTQLGRECEYRADHRPMLSDLPGDVRLESLADEILLLYRDDYYDIYSDARGKVEIEVAKHPAAPRYTIYLNWSDIRQMYTRDHIVRENRESKIPGINAVIEEMDDRLFSGESRELDTFMLATDTLDGTIVIKDSDDKGLAYALALSDGEGDAMVRVDFEDSLDMTFLAETYLKLDDLLEGGMKADYIGVSWGRIEFLFQNGEKTPSADLIIYLEERDEYAGEGSYLRIQFDREALVDFRKFLKQIYLDIKG